MNERAPQSGRALQLVAATREEVRRHIWFCDACAAHLDAGMTPSPFDRRCRACGAGQLLEASEALAPISGDAFLTFDDRLVVTSLSDAAAELLATDAATAIGQPLDALLDPPDAQRAGATTGAQLIAALADGGGGEPTALTARPAGVFGVRLSLRAGVCGPPRRGLVVITCNGASRAGSGELPARERRSSSATTSGPARTPGRWWSRQRPA